MHKYYSKIASILTLYKTAIYFMSLLYGGNIWNGILKHHVIPGWEDNLNGHKNRRFWALYQSMEHRPPIIVSSSFKLLPPKWINAKLKTIDMDFEKRNKMVLLFESIILYENELVILRKNLSIINIVFLVSSILLALAFIYFSRNTVIIFYIISLFTFSMLSMYASFAFSTYMRLNPFISYMDENVCQWRVECIDYFKNSFHQKRTKEIHDKITKRQIRKLKKSCLAIYKTKTTSL